jgi:IS1 family transposase
VWISPSTEFSVFELDELFWFTKNKECTQTRENTYIMTMISRKPRQIVAFAVEKDKSSFRLQGLVDSAGAAESYCTDGNMTYLDVMFPGRHVRNAWDKSDTHNVESINTDLRHYIRGLSRRSRCFFRSLETLQAVVAVFVDAYNKYGEAKTKYRVPVVRKSRTPSPHLHEYREVPFAIIDFL